MSRNPRKKRPNRDILGDFCVSWLSRKERSDLTVILALSTLGTAPHNVTTVPQSSLTENEDALLRDAEIYASNMGVSLDEAVNRFTLQEIAGNLEAEIYEKETETFARLWLEHTPNFRLIVQFTGNGDETLKPYIPGKLTDITEVRTAKVSLATLEEIQKQVTAAKGCAEPSI